jgi:imidazolonepropionase-like amidohydrolase
LLLAVLSLASAREPAPAQDGALDIYLLGRRIGAETWQLDRNDDGVTLTDSFAFVDRGGEVALDSTLELASDLTPRRLRASGRTYRFLRVDVDITVADGVATVTNLGETARVPLPDRFFTVPGYAPLAARALLIEYWERNGRPVSITTVPGAPTSAVFIEARGTDAVALSGNGAATGELAGAANAREPVAGPAGEATEATQESAGAGQSATLRRYIVRGAAWGREVVWLDTDGRLAAIFTRANILPLDGVRTDLAPAYDRLEELTVAEYMSELERMSRDIEPVAEGSFALTGARLIDGTGAAPIEDAVIVVREGRIAAAGGRADTPIPTDIEILDASGTSIVPGLWDMHAHAAQIEWAPAYLAAGVTTVRDMGGNFAFLTALRDATAGGRALGPRFLLAGLVDGAHDNAFGAVTAATPDEGRAAVERYHAAGFAQIKLYSYLQPDVVRAITARAHELGMTVTGHVPRALSLEEALDAGMDQVAHLPVRGDASAPDAERTIEALRRHGAAVDPTASWGELLGRSQQTPIADFQPGILAAPWPIAVAYGSVRNEATPEAVAERMRATLAGIRALRDAGIPILAGTDYGVPAHSLHRELELYVQAGLTPLEALRAASAVPAQIMALADEAGTIEPGKRADLLVLDGDPLADIAAVQRGRWVAADGVMYPCEQLWELADFRSPR